MFPFVDFMEILTPPPLMDALISLPKTDFNPFLSSAFTSKSVYTFPLSVLKARLAGVFAGRLTSTAPLVEYREIGES
jgi:hypothetical protein